MVRSTALTLGLLLAACGNNDSIPGRDELMRQIANEPVGQGRDYWIEYNNMAGEWEKTGLIFGYIDDQGECAKAIAGLKTANPAANYRCTKAN